MPGNSPSDLNVVSTSNSFSGDIGVLGNFTGQFVDVTDYTTITCTVQADQPPATVAIEFEWSEDGINIHSVTQFGNNASTRQTVHATIRTRFVRVKYYAPISGLTNVRLQTLLRKGSIAGGVSRVGIISGEPDAQIVNSISFGERQDGTFRPAGLRDSNFWIVLPYPNLSNTIRQTINATLVSTQFDFFGLTSDIRTGMTVFNDTIRANLYLRYGGAASIGVYDFKIAPQASWSMPYTWITYGGTVFGVWDDTDGLAQILETTTGTPL